jgi:hypothetical protein
LGRCDGVGDDDGVGTMMETLPAASRPKAGSPKDGVGDGDNDGTVSREAASASREATAGKLDSLTAQNQISP